MTEPQGRRFHLEKRLGAGAFGEVYLAEQDSGAGFRRRVALKVLNAQVKGMDEAGRRMRDEARILGRLSHRHIVTVLDMVKLGEQWAVVMDYVPGVDLDRLLQALEKAGEPVPVPAGLEAGAAIAEALDVAFHAEDGAGGTLGVVHRDIKPSNVLLTRDGEVKVLDFGVARVNLDTREARTGFRVGTERYMAPERICGEEDGPPGDVYAAAASVIELLLGRPLGRTPVMEDRHQALVEAALGEVRGRLQGPAEAIDEALDLLGRGVAAEAADRPTARALADGLGALARRLEGESLQVFSRRFVPEVDALLGPVGEPMSGVLSESGSRRIETSNETFAEGGTLGGLDGSGERPGDAEEPPPTAGGGGARWILVAVAGGLLLLAGVVAAGTGAAVVFAGGIWASAEPLEQPTPEIPPLPEPPPGEDAEPSGEADEVAVDEGEADEGTAEVVSDEHAADEAAEASPPADVRPVRRPPAEPEGPRARRAMVVMREAEALVVRCGDVTARGTASARITRFPEGNCTVSATVLGGTLQAEVALAEAAQVECTVADGRLMCS